MKKNFKDFISKKNLKLLINFGKMPLGNGFIDATKFKKKKEYKYEMKLGYNKYLDLVQLYKNPSPKKMFNKDYAFLSSSSNLMKIHFEKYSDQLKKMIKKKKFSIMEVGCNDGILLKNFKQQNHLGIEPSSNVCKIAKSKGLNTLNTFFNKEILNKREVKNRKFDIICGANVFCHIPNLNDIFFTASKLLSEKGIFAIEEPYLGDMIVKTSYDQIYDEHIYIFSISSINKIAYFFNLEVFDAEPQVTHGGSMRYYLCKLNSKKKTERLKKLILNEKKIGLNNFKKLKKFNIQCKISKKKFVKKINKLSSKYDIYGYGATSKSTTVLNYCKIDKKIIIGIFDTSPTKINKLTPVTNIKILEYEKEFKKINPKICVLFAWNHYEEICNKEMLNLRQGMRFVSHIDKKYLFKYKKYFI